MKKIFALCSIILCFAIVLVVFTACEKNNGAGDTTTVATNELPSAVNGDFVFTAEIKADGVVIKNKGEVYQELTYQDTSLPFDFEYAKSHYEFVDMNFDGVYDFYVAGGMEGEQLYCHCWLFNDTTKKFDYHPHLSILPNISVDADTHTIFSKVIIGETVKIAAYGWVDGKLTLKEQFDESDELPDNVGEAVSDNALGVDVTKDANSGKDSQSNKKEDTTKASNSNNNVPGTTKPTSSNSTKPTKGETVTKPEKPLNTTTTSPTNNGIGITQGNIDAGWY